MVLWFHLSNTSTETNQSFAWVDNRVGYVMCTMFQVCLIAQEHCVCNMETAHTKTRSVLMLSVAEGNL